MRHLCALVALSSMLGACGALIGIEDISADTVATTPDGGKIPETGLPLPDAGLDGSMPVVDSGGPVADGATPKKRVFVTSTPTTAKLANHPGVDGADTLCTNAAASAGLTLNGRVWRAWMSGNGKNAIDRITYDGPYFTLTDRQIVANRAQLTSGFLDGPIDITENKVTLTGNEPYAWTGTLANGQGSITCNDWTFDVVSPTVYGIAGTITESTNGKWTNNGGPGGGFPGYGCQLNAHLYCFEM
ncbi:MAG: Tryptophan synthase alpha chain [Myxococcaceae bacterium]|nr:Tryptophan synthase alpha chain [Myxococcaceae bacterium]MEA2746061.1 hypothetical protein [Myxococcales bacterium]